MAIERDNGNNHDAKKRNFKRRKGRNTVVNQKKYRERQAERVNLLEREIIVLKQNKFNQTSLQTEPDAEKSDDATCKESYHSGSDRLSTVLDADNTPLCDNGKKRITSYFDIDQIIIALVDCFKMSTTLESLTADELSNIIKVNDRKRKLRLETIKNRNSQLTCKKAGKGKIHDDDGDDDNLASLHKAMLLTEYIVFEFECQLRSMILQYNFMKLMTKGMINQMRVVLYDCLQMSTTIESLTVDELSDIVKVNSRKRILRGEAIKNSELDCKPFENAQIAASATWHKAMLQTEFMVFEMECQLRSALLQHNWIFGNRRKHVHE